MFATGKNVHNNEYVAIKLVSLSLFDLVQELLKVSILSVTDVL